MEHRVLESLPVRAIDLERSWQDRNYRRPVVKVLVEQFVSACLLFDLHIALLSVMQKEEDVFPEVGRPGMGENTQASLSRERKDPLP